jgi:hypothetical protein
MPDQRCPICGTGVPPWPRYPRALCQACVLEALDAEGRPLRFFNVSLSERSYFA